MEARLGADFGAVRVHSDATAAESAAAVGARAYTVGSQILLVLRRAVRNSRPELQVACSASSLPEMKTCLTKMPGRLCRLAG